MKAVSGPGPSSQPAPYWADPDTEYRPHWAVLGETRPGWAWSRPSYRDLSAEPRSDDVVDDDTPNIVDDTAVAVDGDGQYRAERQTERTFYDSEVIRQVPNDRYTSKRSWF